MNNARFIDEIICKLKNLIVKTKKTKRYSALASSYSAEIELEKISELLKTDYENSYELCIVNINSIIDQLPVNEKLEAKQLISLLKNSKLKDSIKLDSFNITSQKVKIFISHSSLDEKIASSLIDVLEAAFIIKSENIRCTSVPGYKLPIGSQTSEILRNEIYQTELLLGILTVKSIKSSYVLFELGASWGIGRPIFPLLAGGVKSEILPGPLRESNALKIYNSSDCYQLIQEIETLVTLERRNNLSKISEKIQSLVSVSL